MIYSITDRDDDAARMKVCWKKMDNFLRTFAIDYFRAEKEFADGKYGSDWPFRRWLLLKVGVAEDSVLTALKAREHALADAQREERDRAADEGRRAKYAVKYAEQQQREAIRASDAAEKAEKERLIKQAENVAEFLGDYTEAQKAEIIDRYFNRGESEIVITQAMEGNPAAKASSVKVVRVIGFEAGRRADELVRLGIKIKPTKKPAAKKLAATKGRRNGSGGGRKRDTRDRLAAVAAASGQTQAPLAASAPVTNGEEAAWTDENLAMGIRADLTCAFSAQRTSIDERQAWVEASLKLAVKLGEVKRRYPQPGQWLSANNLGEEVIPPDDRAALIGMSRDLPAARIRLEQRVGVWSWKSIWREMKKEQEENFRHVAKVPDAFAETVH